MATNLSTKSQKGVLTLQPIVRKGKRLLIWRKAKGLWKNRKPDPIKELNKMRNEWS